ncbi:MAG TPA: hypothetical protein DCK93_19420 [Blastocatellia bacterium]|nr:hypothetical protein [Blastocatellia bacterium]HAF25044.1 hypothetical protein [Blastocatellia bacterium]
MAEITKLLGIAINDYDVGRLSHAQLISILQEAINSGDILLPDNHRDEMFIDRERPRNALSSIGAKCNSHASRPSTNISLLQSEAVGSVRCYKHFAPMERGITAWPKRQPFNHKRSPLR